MKKPRPKQGPDMAGMRAFLKTDPRATVRCKTCQCVEWGAIVNEFGRLKEKGTASHSWAYFHRHFLRPRGFPFVYATLMNHVRHCLGLEDGVGEGK